MAALALHSSDMPDFMASPFATFLNHRRTKDQRYHNPAPLFASEPTDFGVLHPPLEQPPLPKRRRSPPPFRDFLHERPLPTLKQFPPALVTDTDAIRVERQTSLSFQSEVSSAKNERSDSYPSLASGKRPREIQGEELSSVQPRGPMFGSVSLLNSPTPEDVQHRANCSFNSMPEVSMNHAVQTPQSAGRISPYMLHLQALSKTRSTKKPDNRAHRPFTCRHEGCSASFIKQNHLSRHIRIVHNKERPYHCTEPGCGSRFGSKSHLGDHTRAVHMRIKLFKCDMCDASWSKRFNLKKHIRVRHLGEKPFGCQQCQLSFGTRSHATRHELKVHKRSFAEANLDLKSNMLT